MRSRMTNLELLNSAFRELKIKPWIASDIDRVDQLAYSYESLWSEPSPIEEAIHQMIEKEKKNMNYQFISELNNYCQNATLSVGSAKIPVKIDAVEMDRYNHTTKLVCINNNDLLEPGVGVWFNRTINPIALGEKTIEKVIFNNPATIVIWKDGTKTVVKTQNGEQYDPEKGFAMAIAKKALGNEGNYYNTFAKWLKESEEAKG